LLKRKHKILRKNILFLLVWDKNSNTEIFLVLLLHICILQSILVHFYHNSSLLSRLLPIVASVSFRLLFSLLYSEHINHIQVLGFLSFPYSSHVHSPLTVWSSPIILLHLF
jgi:hypothetical protein